MQALWKAAETGDRLVFVCEEWKRLWKGVGIEEKSTARSWRSSEDLDCGIWVIKEKNMDGMRDLVAELMSKIKLLS